MRFVSRATLSALLILILMTLPGGAFARKKGKVSQKARAAAEQADPSASAPDKVLFDRAEKASKKGHHEMARLTLQTLINTYPDSEYLAKAKLAIADSFFKEGGSANLTQAASGYKDFIVFFPFLQEASYAQLQVAMVHYKQLDKPDRDRTHAKAAEAELQEFLQKYPDDPLAAQAEQRLREVQEVLAEGDYRIGYFYYVKGKFAYRAAAARLMALTNRYPLYSHSDHALWMLGTIFEQGERKDLAGAFYARIVRNYPLSPMSPEAKKKLTALRVPIPQPDPVALARMQQDQAIPRKKPGMLHKSTGLFRTGPDVQMAARVGKPNLEPESVSPGTDILTPGGTQSVGGPGGATNAVVATVTPGATTTKNADSDSGAATEPPPAPAAEPPANKPAGDPPATSAEPAAETSAAPVQTDSAAAPAEKSAAAANAPAETATPGDAKPGEKKNQKESSSKKKKGLRKIIPF
ncbi:MAG: outer membrane protein assembly factor BamD [Acidobacteriia bacterium]|nr:outer membrane protein assembly factor BamD [Terriglobia bacterium]